MGCPTRQRARPGRPSVKAEGSRPEVELQSTTPGGAAALRGNPLLTQGLPGYQSGGVGQPIDALLP